MSDKVGVPKPEGLSGNDVVKTHYNHAEAFTFPAGWGKKGDVINMNQIEKANLKAELEAHNAKTREAWKK